MKLINKNCQLILVLLVFSTNTFGGVLILPQASTRSTAKKKTPSLSVKKYAPTSNSSSVGGQLTYKASPNESSIGSQFDYIAATKESAIQMLINATAGYEAGTITKDDYVKISIQVSQMADYSNKVVGVVSNTAEPTASALVDKMPVASYPANSSFTTSQSDWWAKGRQAAERALRNAKTPEEKKMIEETILAINSQDGNLEAGAKLAEIQEQDAKIWIVKITALGEANGKLYNETQDRLIKEYNLKASTPGVTEEEKVLLYAQTRINIRNELDKLVPASSAPPTSSRAATITTYINSFNGNGSPENIRIIKARAAEVGVSASEIDVAMGYPSGTTQNAFDTASTAPAVVAAPVAVSPVAVAPVALSREATITTYINSFNGNASPENLRIIQARAAEVGVSANEIDAAMGYPSGTTQNAFDSASK